MVREARLGEAGGWRSIPPMTESVEGFFGDAAKTINKLKNKALRTVRSANRCLQCRAERIVPRLHEGGRLTAWPPHQTCRESLVEVKRWNVSAAEAGGDPTLIIHSNQTQPLIPLPQELLFEHVKKGLISIHSSDASPAKHDCV